MCTKAIRLSARERHTWSPVVSAVSAWSSPVGWWTAAPARVVLGGRSRALRRAAQRCLAELEARARNRWLMRGDVAPARRGRAASSSAGGAEPGCALRGVVHGAAVIEDQIIAALHAAETAWSRVVGAQGRRRACGCTSAASANRELDWWVGFSSAVVPAGLRPGRAAYAARECVARRRWSRGARHPVCRRR